MSAVVGFAIFAVGFVVGVLTLAYLTHQLGMWDAKDDATDAIDAAHLAGGEQIAEQMDVVVEDAWRNGFLHGATEYDCVVVHDRPHDGLVDLNCEACKHLARLASERLVPALFAARGPQP